MKIRIVVYFVLNCQKYSFTVDFDSLYDLHNFLTVLNVGFDYEFYVYLIDECSNFELRLGSIDDLDDKIYEKELPF